MQKIKLMRKRTKQEFIELAKVIHGDKYDYSKAEYVDGQTKVCIICPEHGEFWQRPCDHINQKQGCPKCVKNHRDTTETFIKKAKLIHGDRYDYSKVKYVNSQTKVCIICPEHGEFWQTPSSHISGRGCPTCRWDKAKNSIRKAQGLTREQFIEKAIGIHGDKYDYSKVVYENTDTPVCIICPEHGEFWQTPHHHLSGSGCPECGKNDISEKKLTDILNENFDNLIRQYKPDFLRVNGKPQSIDIFLPEYNVGVEYQGRQHFVPVSRYGGIEEYKKTVERDKRKFNKCKEHGITILYFSYEKEIPDTYLSKVFTNETELINNIKKIS